MQSILDFEFLDNTVQNFGIFILLILAAYLFKKYISHFLSAIAYRFFRKYSTESEAKTFRILLTKPFEFFVLFVTIFYAFKWLHYPQGLAWKNEDWDAKILFNQIFKSIGAVSITWIFLRIVDFLSFVFYHKYSDHDRRVDKQIVPFIKDSTKVGICILSLILILGVIFKLNVASIIAGIGIGGLAVALAAKESLENLFGSFTILADKPFSVGDTIKVGNYTGTVEKVGFRSTRLRTDNKTFVTVPNKQIVDSFLDNLTERTHRRVEFKLHLKQNSSIAAIQKIISSMNNLLEKTELVEMESPVYLHGIGKYSIDILISYLVQPFEVNRFNEIKQTINFEVLKMLEAEKLELAVFAASEES